MLNSKFESLPFLRTRIMLSTDRLHSLQLRLADHVNEQRVTKTLTHVDFRSLNEYYQHY